MKIIKESNYSFRVVFVLTLVLLLNNSVLATESEAEFFPGIKKVVFNSGSERIEIEPEDITNIDAGSVNLLPREIPFDNNSVLFLLDPVDPERDLIYSFYLKGHDPRMLKAVPYPFKEYSNLAPGKYSFFVKILDPVTGRSEHAVFEFSILPPFYRTLVAWFLYLIMAVLIFFTYLRIQNYRFAREKFRLERIINERTDELVREKDKSEKLLSNVLPKGTADELKSKGKASKKKYNMATVLFSDIQGFTKIAEQMNPEKLIDELDSFFFHFDSVVEKYNIEKIKTIGDAYMCAGGIPVKNRTNPVEVVLAALEMQIYMKDLHDKAIRDHDKIWDIRIGIHTGSVIAGVVGHKKLSYDIWGDTVNTASRMESSGEAGKVNVSGSTYQLVKDFFICEYRGKMPVKYKGEIDMYFVKGIRPELIDKSTGQQGDGFRIKLQLLRLEDLETGVLDKFEKEEGEKLRFHTRRHTVNVYTQAELLGRAEKVKDEEMLLLRTAALLHDVGYLVDFEDPHIASADYAREVLPQYHYLPDQVERVCELIIKGKAGVNDHLSRILCDANLDYLGRIDFGEVAINIYDEQKRHGKAGSFEDWKKEQRKMMESHEYYTRTAEMLRDVSGEKQLAVLDSLSFPV